MTNGHFRKAWRYYSRARSEMESARTRKDTLAAQQAAGKAWLAAVEALNAYLLECKVPPARLPRNDRGRRFMLRKHAPREMRLLFDHFRSLFHLDAYYDAIIDWPSLDDGMRGLEEMLRSLRQT